MANHRDGKGFKDKPGDNTYHITLIGVSLFTTGVNRVDCDLTRKGGIPLAMPTCHGKWSIVQVLVTHRLNMK